MDDIGTKTPPPMPAGLVPLDFGGEVNDHGEESYFRAKMLARALRRLDRWEGGKGVKMKGERSMHVERPLYRSEDEEDDEDMMDVDERGGEEESSDESEDEEMEAERGRWDPHVLLPLPRMA
jgi:Ino eighty subunit 1